MTLTEKLLPRLSEWRLSGEGRHSWAEAFPAHGWNVRLTADRTDSLSCLAWELALTRTNAPPEGLTLRAWATTIASRVTGLLEPLVVHEVDEIRNEAILRSGTPAAKGESVAYHEVRLSGLTAATLRRFTASRTEFDRNQIAFAITHEALAKLAGDLAG